MAVIGIVAEYIDPRHNRPTIMVFRTEKQLRAWLHNIADKADLSFTLQVDYGAVLQDEDDMT
mgnify:FL=1